MKPARHYPKSCEQCSVSFVAGYPLARFCGVSCRVRAYRHRRSEAERGLADLAAMH